ncbi:MAG: YigZ family protein [Spirochaetales bacterium]|nr:YigZ family protein [Spirochaetales bacterium]
MLVPAGEAVAEIEIKKSRFIAITCGVESAEGARTRIRETRDRYPDATHVVHAFLTGPRGDIFGFSDDHEPSGTAGRPVLEVLRGSGISNILLMVVRYFGGTKLGTGGLVKAYTQAAQEVLKTLPVEEKVERCKIKLTFPYELFDQGKKILFQEKARIIEEQFGLNVEVIALLPADNLENCRSLLTNLSRGAAIMEIL